MSSGHVMCYVQHLMGSGHQWRIASISRALCKLGLEVTYVSGGMPVPGLDVGCARFVQLAPARSADMRYQTLVDVHGTPVDDAWRAMRRSQLLDVFHECSPDALLIETFPFGRRLLRFELLPLLDAAHSRRPRPRIIGSVRDILEQRRTPGRNEEIVDLVNRYFDLILVHSDASVVPFEATFPFATRIRDRLHNTGYVMARDPDDATGAQGRGEVVVSAGGGAFGEHLLRTAIAARPLCALAHLPWRILVGQNLPRARFEDLSTAAGDGLMVERNRSDFSTLLKNCALSISQAGYNTMLEVLASGARAVLVPYSDERECEQAMRARLFAHHGLADIVHNQGLTPLRLARAVGTASRRTLSRRATIDVRGAETSAQLIAARVVQRARVARVGA